MAFLEGLVVGVASGARSALVAFPAALLVAIVLITWRG